MRTPHAIVLPLLLACALGSTAWAAPKKKAAPARSAPKATVHKAPEPEPKPAPAAAEASPAPAPVADKKDTLVKEEAASSPRGPARIDFDDRLIQGQTNKSGAVYLFDRKELVIKSMVNRRATFREQIIKDVQGE